MRKILLWFIVIFSVLTSASAFDFSLLDAYWDIKENNSYSPSHKACKLKEINLQTFWNTNFWVNALYPNIFPCDWDTDFWNNAFNDSIIFSYQKSPGYPNVTGAVSSIVFIYDRLTDFYIGYPYIKNWAFDFHYIQIDDDEKYSSTYYWQPLEYDWLVPLQWGMNLYKYNSPTDIKISQYSNGQKYDWYYMNIEDNNVFLFDFERKIVYNYLNVWNSFQTIWWINFWWKIFSTLFNSQPSSVRSFSYTAWRDRIVDKWPAWLSNMLTPNVVVWSAYTPNFTATNNWYSNFDQLWLYIHVDFVEPLAINTPAFYSVTIPPTTYATGSFSNYETASNWWFWWLTDWISWLTSWTFLDFNSTWSLLWDINGLTVWSWENNPILAPVQNLFDKFKNAYQIPNIFPKYSHCSNTSSSPFWKTLLYWFFIFLSLSLFFKFK